jgi:hypothetical protein
LTVANLSTNVLCFALLRFAWLNVKHEHLLQMPVLNKVLVTVSVTLAFQNASGYFSRQLCETKPFFQLHVMGQNEYYRTTYIKKRIRK